MTEETAKGLEVRLSCILKECELDGFVNVEKIKNWISCIEVSHEKPADFSCMTMIAGLLDEKHFANKKLVTELFNTIGELYRCTPIKALQHKTSIAKLKETKEDVVLYLTDVKLPPDDWQGVYWDAMDLMRRKKFSAATKKFDEVCTTLLNDRTTTREIYRIYSNAGISNLFAGNYFLGVECLRIATELNPKYKFAQEQLKKVESGEFESVIQLGYMKRIMEGLKELTLPLKLSPNEVNRWGESKILRRLSKLGIKVNKREFIECAKRVYSTDTLAKELFYSQIEEENIKDGKNKDSDFIWMAAMALWNIYCPDEPVFQNFDDTIIKAFDFVSEHTNQETCLDQKNISMYQQYLEKIKKFIVSDKKDFLKNWSETFEYSNECRDDLIFILSRFVVCHGLKESVFELVLRLKNEIPIWHWDIIEIADLIYKNDPAWKILYEQIRNREPYFCYIAYDISRFFESINNIETAEQYLLESLQIVDERAKRKVFDLQNHTTTIYNDYKFILDKIKNFYERNKHDKTKLQFVDNKQKEIDKKFDEYSYSPAMTEFDSAFSELITKTEMENTKSSPPIKYYEYLKKYGINFATEEEVGANITHIVINESDYKIEDDTEKPQKKHKRKIGRNEPCPCGSGKKYKKCCGKMV